MGVSDHVLRAWESRYGLLRPVRSPGGFRLYSDGDEQRVRRMQFHLARGLGAAEAARAAIAEGETRGAPAVGAHRSGGEDLTELPALAADLRTALDALDEPAAQAVLDRLMSDFTVAAALRDVVLPYLGELGERWANGELTIAHEHFASNVIRGRLAGLARGWGNGNGPRAVLACPPGELHDLPLMIFGIILNRHGWRVDFFGVSTPVVDLVDDARRSPPDLIVVAATVPERLTADPCGPGAAGRRGAARPRRCRRVTRHRRRGRRPVAHRRPRHRRRNTRQEGGRERLAHERTTRKRRDRSMFLALKEMRRAWVRFGLLIAAIGLLVFLILFQQALQSGLVTSFVGAIRNQSAPVLVYSVDGQRVLQGSVITPDLEQIVRATPGIAEIGYIGQGTFTVTADGEPADATIIGYEREGVGSPRVPHRGPPRRAAGRGGRQRGRRR